ncbi:unnamed protein product [Darwinula stevensoni]|uniref:RUN domain-containing protein n=1 Tax=Darwinula stevensoni TaxID=69355 RepID=A0A7R9AFG4_9CRUS|nr:unnamed protein product [Darwinula stevensoni]CAG0902849.1 unnamed protein product [Darwinula stevensoni]
MMEESHVFHEEGPDDVFATKGTEDGQPLPFHALFESNDFEGAGLNSWIQSDDESDEGGQLPTMERMAPLGADHDEVEDLFQKNVTDQEMNWAAKSSSRPSTSENDKLRMLEEEQEQLTTSLLQLTTHFAQVQFRLQQIVSAPSDEKEKLLKELEEFAFRGIPDMRGLQTNLLLKDEQNMRQREERLREQRQKQVELIGELKTQLEDLERYAYETGDAGLPQNLLLERQKLVIDELKGHLDLNLEDLDRLSLEELKQQVDKAVGQVMPIVLDLMPRNVRPVLVVEDRKREGLGFLRSRRSGQTARRWSRIEMRAKTVQMMRKVLNLLHMFADVHFGCGSEPFRRNILKETRKGNHWGDLRARLEVAIARVARLAAEKAAGGDSDYTSDSEDFSRVAPDELVMAVRKDFAMALKDLMQHGLVQTSDNTSLVPRMGCFPTRSAQVQPERHLHPWELLLAYYDIRGGPLYNATPQRKLAQSFGLDIIGSNAVTAKQTLLGAIGNVITSHTPLKRSMDAHFKAFICEGLNSKRLISWLKLIFRSTHLVNQYYQPWSYALRTGFEDTFHSMEKLMGFEFDLPADLAVRQLRAIKDAF